MTRTKPDDEEEVIELERRAAELKLRIREQKIVAGMKARRDIIDPLYQKIIALGGEEKGCATSTSVLPQSDLATSRSNKKLKHEGIKDQIRTTCTSSFLKIAQMKKTMV